MVSLWTVSFCLILVGSMAENPPPPTVKTQGGILEGKFMKVRGGRKIEAFLGIPFAKPPLGVLRFEPPQPPDPWKGVRKADTVAPACMQFKMSVGEKSEDCLYLNVFTPGRNNSLDLPVMVWVHGGTFMYNGASTFTPEYMCAETNIVLVTVQYRLGIFGFLCTCDPVMPGNQGLKDMRQGLRWVRDNIRQFGGDPSKVTLFGQSAGAMSIHALVLFTSKDGLFRAAITQSGVSMMSAAFRLPAECRYQVEMIAMTSECPSDSRGLVSCLKNKSAVEILNLIAPQKLLTVQPNPGLFLEPECVKDRIISDNPWNLKVEIPWLTGVMGAEMLEFLAPIAADMSNTLFAATELSFNVLLPKSLNYQFSSANESGLAAAVRQFYLANLPISRVTFAQLVQALTDGTFIYPIYEAALRSKNLSQTFMYKTDFIGANHAYEPIPHSEMVGASHEDDIYWLFSHPNSILEGRIHSCKDEEFSKRLVKIWTNFATNLHPTKGLDMLQWEPFGSKENYYHFGESDIELKYKFLPERMDFWKNQPYIYRDDSIVPIKCDSER